MPPPPYPCTGADLPLTYIVINPTYVPVPELFMHRKYDSSSVSHNIVLYHW